MQPSKGCKVVSMFFQESNEAKEKKNIDENFLNIIEELNYQLEDFSLNHLPSTVASIYNPTIYAKDPFQQYVNKYCNAKKTIMYLGMNPGPWGMSQTGVPFGEIGAVKDWLRIEGIVGKPPTELKNRQVKGFDCKRSEISGKKFWGLFKDYCKVPEFFFENSFVYNYLPQQWLKENGCNVTPNEFNLKEMQYLYQICDPILCKVLQLYEVKIIVAIGRFCENRAKKVLNKYFSAHVIRIVYLHHPSPRCLNNKDWSMEALNTLRNNDLLQYYKSY